MMRGCPAGRVAFHGGGLRIGKLVFSAFAGNSRFIDRRLAFARSSTVSTGVNSGLPHPIRLLRAVILPQEYFSRHLRLYHVLRHTLDRSIALQQGFLSLHSCIRNSYKADWMERMYQLQQRFFHTTLLYIPVRVETQRKKHHSRHAPDGDSASCPWFSGFLCRSHHTCVQGLKWSPCQDHG